MGHGLGGELHHRVAKRRRRLAPQYLVGRGSGSSGRAAAKLATVPWTAGGLGFKLVGHLRQVDRMPRGHVRRDIGAAFRGVVRRAAKQRRQAERATHVYGGQLRLLVVHDARAFESEQL